MKGVRIMIPFFSYIHWIDIVILILVILVPIIVFWRRVKYGDT